jgi:hypothetical protein
MGASASNEQFHAAVTTDTFTSNEQFHTVVIRGNLPTVKKQYSADKPTDLPEPNYWVGAVAADIASDRWHRSIEPDRFKMQYMISNGPCKFF